MDGSVSPVMYEFSVIWSEGIIFAVFFFHSLLILFYFLLRSVSKTGVEVVEVNE